MAARRHLRLFEILKGGTSATQLIMPKQPLDPSAES
jgi:hypothetical protein